MTDMIKERKGKAKMNKSNGNRPGSGTIERKAELTWVRLDSLEPSKVAQRNKLNQSRVNHICAHLDLEQIGNPTINSKGDHNYIIDGWHRIEALRQFGFQDSDQFECWTYYNLTEEQEAQRFLTLNDTLRVDAFSKFRVSVNAGRTREVNIQNILGSLGLRVGINSKDDKTVASPQTLCNIHDRFGPMVLARTLRLILDSFGNAGLQALVIEGIALVVARYPDQLDDQFAASKLSKMHGGVSGLTGKAHTLKLQTGYTKAQCVAAATVEVINAGRNTGKRLTPWFKAAPQDRERKPVLVDA